MFTPFVTLYDVGGEFEYSEEWGPKYRLVRRTGIWEEEINGAWVPYSWGDYVDFAEERKKKREDTRGIALGIFLTQIQTSKYVHIRQTVLNQM